MHHKICAVIVTYKANSQIIELLNALLTQVSHIYLIDNGSEPDIITILQKFSVSNPATISIIINENNLGIATAQNQGIKKALANSFDWVIFIDDDSLPEADMVQRMFTAWQKQNDEKIAIIAPRLIEQNISTPSRHLISYGKFLFKHQPVGNEDILLNVAMVIASGSLIRAEVFNKAGLMREGLFIDYVDHEFCLRAQIHGYKIMVVGNAVLRHKQGNKRSKNIVGFPININTPNYSPLRYYHIFRNRLFFLRLYGKQFPFLIAHEILACALDIFRVICYEEDKIKKLRTMISGLNDGINKSIPQIAH